MEYRILGSLEVRVEGRALRLAGRKQRAVLAYLLLHPNEVVSSDKLIDALWGDEAPGTGANALQARVSQLRKALGPDARAFLQTTPAGYVLRLEPGQLDAEQFERLLAAGREALARGDAATAARLLRKGLALWRGAALSDFAYEEFAQAEIARFEELRLAALEERIEADLALALHAELIGELEALIREHPPRERLRGQLMLALYRSGRQTEALDAYHQARAALVESLGIEPSPPLRHLQRAILEQDRSLAPSLPDGRAPFEQVAIPAPVETVELSAERKLATALFADLPSSGQRGLDPERVRVRLDRFWDAAAAEIEGLGGTVERFAGGAVTAIFGAPVALEDHAERALHAALALRERVGELFGSAPPLQIGIESGEILVSRPHPGSSVLAGDALEVAARLAHAAAPGEILVGERSATAAGGAFELGGFGDAEAGEFACRPLVGALSASRPRGVRGLPQVFVGREPELEVLRAAYRRVVREAARCLVTIIGEAGVGKTRLVREFSQWLAGESPEPLRRTGRCLPYGRGITYWPLGEILKEQLGLLESDTPEVVRRRLGEHQMLGLAVGLEPGENLHPLEARERLHAACVDWVDELARERPVVLLIEDLHWGEEPLLDLLERLVRDVRGPLLLLCTARPELFASRPSWSSGLRNAAMLRLEPLGAEEATTLVDELLGSQVPANVRTLLLDRAEGNPFFLEELIGTLIDRGMFARANGDWVALGLPTSLEVPNSVQAALASRIDLLPPLEKAALEAASVIGRVFWPGPVRELLDGAAPDFALLEERDFVRRRSGSSMVGQQEYAIKHALTRDVAYGTITKTRRAHLHAACAAWLERTGEGRDEHAPFLAHHYFEAVRPEDADLVWADDEGELQGLREKAATWLRRAADLAVTRYAINEALALRHRALELEPNRSGQIELWQAIGHASALRYDGEGLWTAMENALELGPDRPTQARIFSELALQTAYRSGMWKRSPDPELVSSWITRALELSEEDSPERVGALVARTWWPPPSADTARGALALAERLGDPRLSAFALLAMADPASAAKDFEEAWRWVARCLELLDQVADPDQRTLVLLMASFAVAGAGRIADARAFAGKHDELAARLTTHHQLHGVGVLVLVEELAGGWEAIRELKLRVESAVEANLLTPCMLNERALLTCAIAEAYLGDEDESRRLERKADELGTEGYGRSLSAARLRLALLRNDMEAVERLMADPIPQLRFLTIATTAIRLDGLAALGDGKAVEEEALQLQRPGTYLEPFALRALGIVRDDSKLVAQAASRFDAIDLRWHAEQTRALLAGERVETEPGAAFAEAGQAEEG